MYHRKNCASSWLPTRIIRRCTVRKIRGIKFQRAVFRQKLIVARLVNKLGATWGSRRFFNMSARICRGILFCGRWLRSTAGHPIFIIWSTVTISFHERPNLVNGQFHFSSEWLFCRLSHFFRACFMSVFPSIHVWRYNPIWALASLKRRCHSSLAQVRLLHRIPRTCMHNSGRFFSFIITYWLHFLSIWNSEQLRCHDH